MWNYRPEAWVLPGIIVIVFLTLIAMLLKAGQIENDLTQRALQKLSDQHAWAKVQLDGRNLKLSGIAPSDSDKSAALIAADGAFFNREEGTWGVRVVDGTGIEPLPVASPFSFNIEHHKGTLRLSGNIPAESTRDELLKQATTIAPDAALRDDMTLAAGAPEKFREKAGFAIDILKETIEGRATTSDTQFDLVARVASIDIAKTLDEKLKAPLPHGLVLRTFDLEAPKPEPEPAVTPETLPEPIIEAAPEKIIVPEIAAEPTPETLAESELETIEAPEPADVAAPIIEAAPEPSIEPTLPPAPAPNLEIEPAPVVVAKPKPVKPEKYTFNMEKTTSGIKLSGAVLSDAEREKLIKNADALKAGAVVENLTVDEHTPEEFSALGDYGLGLLSQMDNGSVSATGKQVSIKGIAANQSSLDIINSTLQKLPQGLTLDTVDLSVLEVSPYIFSAIKNGSQIILSGNIPSQLAKDQLLKETQTLAIGDVDDKMVFSAGNPTGFANSLSYAVGLLAHFSDGSVLISDTDLIVDGSALTLQSYDAAKQALKTPPEGFKLISGNVDLPIVSPYVWSVTLKDSTVTTTGLMPDATSQSNVKPALEVLLPNGTIVDDTRIAEGNPNGLNWVEATTFGIGFLTHLKTGTVSLSDTVLSIQGEATTPDNYNEAIAALSAAWPKGFQKGEIVIERPTVSPFILSAKRDDDQLSIMGFIPNKTSRQKIIDHAKRRFGGEINELDLIIAKGEPRGFDTATNISLLSLSRLTKGSFEITDTEVTLSGVAPFGAPLGEIKSNFENGLPIGFVAKTALTQSPPPEPTRPDECSARILAASTTNTIYFQSGRATILSDSFGFLDGVAEIALSCPAAQFEISGHTDSDGSAESNQRLSIARSTAVSDYLQRAGVEKNRLLAVGFGEEKPIADNDTPENKALNRRIEFRLITE